MSASDFQFYSNENFPLPVVEAMRRRGYDVLTSQDARKANQRVPDDEVLAYATERGRALLTINRKDFIRLHRHRETTGGPHAGIIVCTGDPDFERQATRIIDALGSVAEMNGVLIRVNRPDR